MSKNEDVPSTYPYQWSPGSELPLQDFLTKNHVVQTVHGSKRWEETILSQWIWVYGTEPKQEDAGAQDAIAEASILLNEVTDRVEEIKNDTSIPVRSNKKTGVKGKKEVREQVQAEATESLKDIAVKHGYVSGKWLIFVSAEKVDMIWSNLATSFASGPLASTFAHIAKVATSSNSEDNPNNQHLICVYMPDIYDKDKVTEVMKVLLRNHGVSLSGVKSNLYTALGLDSKHASGIPSTTWKNSALLSDKESKELKDAFFANLPSDKATASNNANINVEGVTEAALSKIKPRLKKKAVDDLFASDNDEDEDEERRKKEILAKTTKAISKPQPKKTADDEDAEEVKQKEEIRNKNNKKHMSEKRQASDAEVSEDDRPKKRKVDQS